MCTYIPQTSAQTRDKKRRRYFRRCFLSFLRKILIQPCACLAAIASERSFERSAHVLRFRSADIDVHSFQIDAAPARGLPLFAFGPLLQKFVVRSDRSFDVLLCGFRFERLSFQIQSLVDTARRARKKKIEEGEGSRVVFFIVRVFAFSSKPSSPSA